jgi:lincosamide and streptogramin A transport system ATP-binding/permease protein
MQARETVARYLGRKSGFILVSHDRAFLDACVDHILSINRADIEIQSGNFSSWYYNKELQDAYELDKNEQLKREIGRLETAAKRTEKWSDKAEKTKIGGNPNTSEQKSIGHRAHVGEKSRKMMARSKAIGERQQREIDEKSKLLKNIEEAAPLKLSTLEYHAARLVTLDKVTLSYDGREVCRDVTFEVRQGDRIALYGRNGCGKSSVLKLICGDDIDHTGDVRVGSGLKISYVPQDASFLSGDLSDYARECGIDETLCKTILRKLDFSRVQFEKDMRDYSAGQKKKVLLARSLCERAHLYIWDEPLNYIDVLSRMQIEELIREFTPTLLFVEHDRAFCDGVATEIVQM